MFSLLEALLMLHNIENGNQLRRGYQIVETGGQIIELFRNRRRLLMVIAICAVVVIGATVLLWPSGPKKPSIIPLGDYSYTIEYVDYQINTLMKNTIYRVL